MTSALSVALLAGGLATRLGELTKKEPKALVKVNAVPFIDYQLRWLAHQGITTVVLCVGHFANQIETFVGNGSQYGLTVKYSYDGGSRLGTGGAIHKALPLLGSEFFVMYGDSYLQLSLSELATTHFRSRALATMAIFRNQGLWDTSNVIVDGSKASYSSFPEKKAEYIDYGVSIIRSDSFRDFECYGPWELPVFFEELSKKGELRYYEAKERFFEVGSFDGLRSFEEFVSKKERHELRSTAFGGDHSSY